VSVDEATPLVDPEAHRGRRLTALICPACTGVLSVEEEGKKGHLRFVCRVGHAFSSSSLLDAKEHDVERTLWSAVDLLEEALDLARELATRAHGSNGAEQRRGLEERIARGVAHVAELRRIAESNMPSGLPEPP
jgi:two-component system, chemotaxis family, protein-glutamate methylesterase/glutaminase